MFKFVYDQIMMMKSFLAGIAPPDSWKVPVISLLGIFAGFVLYIIYISKAPSYLSDNPETCVNCHIMAPQYATWNHSSHREIAHCNDCHVPHNNVVNKYYFKAKDGLRHAAIFTLRSEPQVTRIKNASSRVIQQNCIRCHISLIEDFRMQVYDDQFNDTRKGRSCSDCHRETPHGRVNSISSVPYARIPLPESPVPEWMKKIK